MTSRPVIFISAVSKELKSARQLVANTLTFLGYEPEWLDIFSTEQGDLRGMLRRRIDASKAVVQLVGQCYGAEPPQPTEEFGRVSYTQYEALYARSCGKNIWYLILNEDFRADPHEEEPPALRELQTAYRKQLKADNVIRHSSSSAEALEASVLRLRDELAELRRRGKQWAAGVLALLVVIALLVVWLVRSGTLTSRQMQAVTTLQEKMVTKEDLPAALSAAFAGFLRAEAKAGEPHPGQKPEEIEARIYAQLAKDATVGMDAKTLREKLPEFAKQLQHAPEISTYDRATAAYILKDYVEAERLALLAAGEAQNERSPRLDDATKALQLAGLSAQKLNHYTSALNHFRSAAALIDRALKPAEWADVQEAAGYVVLADLGKPGEAKTILEDVVAVREQALSGEHPDTLRSRGFLARAYLGLGQYAEAENELRRVVSTLERVRGGPDLQTLSTRSDLSGVLAQEGKYAEAEKQARMAMLAQERALPPEHEDILMSRMNVANALYFQGKYADAEEEYRTALPMFERRFGAQNPLTFKARNNLAETLRSEGKFTEGEQEARLALKGLEAMYDSNHPDILMARATLAGSLFGQGRHLDAEKEFRAVLQIQERVLSRDHPDTLKTRNNLANLLLVQSKYPEAEREFRALLSMFADKLSPEHPYTLLTNMNLAGALANQDKLKEALRFAKEAEKGLQRIGDPNYENARTLREQIQGAQR